MMLLVNSLAYPNMGSEVLKPIKPISHMQTSRKTLPDMEPDEVPVYPERRLWTAVILHTVVEYEMQLQHIRKLWDADPRPISKHLLTSLRCIRHEVRHDWFRYVCELADVDQSHMVNCLKRLDEKYKLSEVQFSAENRNVTRYQINKSKAGVRHG